MGAQKVDKGQVRDREQEMETAGETRVLKTVGGSRSRTSQTTAMTKIHDEVKGGRSHGGDAFYDTMGMSDGDRASAGGDPGGAEEMESQGDSGGP